MRQVVATLSVVALVVTAGLIGYHGGYLAGRASVHGFIVGSVKFVSVDNSDDSEARQTAIDYAFTFGDVKRSNPHVGED